MAAIAIVLVIVCRGGLRCHRRHQEGWLVRQHHAGWGTLVVIGLPVLVIGFLVPVFRGREVGAPAAGVQLHVQKHDPAGIVLGSLSVATALRLTSTSVDENLNADYVRTATSKGLSRNRVIGAHVLRNSLIPVITFLGVELGNLMTGAIITETIFNVPGIGRALQLAINQQDGPTVVAIVSVLVVVFLVANLVVDLLYAVLDPRIRYS